MLVATLMRYEAPTYGDYHYDVWGNVFGWAIALVSLIPIPVVAVHQLWHAKGTFKEVTHLPCVFAFRYGCFCFPFILLKNVCVHHHHYSHYLYRHLAA